MHRRDESIVLFAISVVHEGFPTCFEDDFSREDSLSLEYACSFEEIESISEIATSEMSDEK